MVTDDEPEHGAVTGRPMDADERDRFLTRPLICRIACLDRLGWPYNVPVWFEWSEQRFWILAAGRARWIEYLRADSRVSLCIDAVDPLQRVICQGHAHLAEGPAPFGHWEPLLRRMSERYVGEGAEAYVRSAATIDGWLIRVDPERTTTWSGPGRAS